MKCANVWKTVITAFMAWGLGACGEGAFSAKSSSSGDAVPSSEGDAKIEEIDPTQVNSLDDLLDDVPLSGTDLVVKAQLRQFCSIDKFSRAIKITAGLLGSKEAITLDGSTIIILVGHELQLDVTSVTQDIGVVCLLSVGKDIGFNLASNKNISHGLSLSVGSNLSVVFDAAEPAKVDRYTLWMIGKDNVTKLQGSGTYTCPTPLRIGVNNTFTCK